MSPVFLLPAPSLYSRLLRRNVWKMVARIRAKTWSIGSIGRFSPARHHESLPSILTKDCTRSSSLLILKLSMASRSPSECERHDLSLSLLLPVLRLDLRFSSPPANLLQGTHIAGNRRTRRNPEQWQAHVGCRTDSSERGIYGRWRRLENVLAPGLRSMC